MNLRILIENQFVRSSGIVLAGSTAANFINYLFNLVMGRMLSPIEYGEMAALVTLAMIVAVPSMTLSNLTAKYISEHKALGEENLATHTYKDGIRISLKIGLVLLVVFWALTPWMASFFKIDKLPIFIFGTLLPLSMIAGVAKGTLQGSSGFTALSVANILEAGFKLILAAALVYLGLSVAGAVGGLIIGSLIALTYSFIKIKSFIRSPESQTGATEYKVSRLPGYAKLVFWSNLFLAVFGNIDVVLAKHYLPEVEAGHYAALAVLGRIITFASIAVITVLLPQAAAENAKQGESRNLLRTATLLTLIVSGIILAFFFMIPEWTVSNLFGHEYLAIASYLGIFGLIMMLGSLSKVLINYFLAIHEKRFIYAFGVFTLLQFVLILFLHQSIWQIMMVLLMTNVLLLTAMSINYLLIPKNA